MSNSNEIRKLLEKIPREFSVAFATRSALRVLPLLVTKEANNQSFWYWDNKEKEKYLLAIFTSTRFSLGYCFGLNASSKEASKSIASVASTVGAIAANATATSTSSNASTAALAYDAVSIAYAAFYASSTVYTSSAVAPIYASNAAAYAAFANIHNNYETETQSDLNYLQKNLDIHAYIQRPLWDQFLPKDWETIWKRFQQWTKALDSGFDIWLDWYQDRLDGEAFDLELLEKQVNIPAEIEDQGVSAVNAYLATLTRAKKLNKELKPLNLVRAIFIGNGTAGKTSLIKALNGEPVVEGKEKMTPGIDIREWPVGDTGITAHFWDFGGQVMAHSTHQFFLRERCLYILVMDARTEINANEQAEYWLEHVRTFGKNAPVMLVGNKSDLTQVNLDMFSLREKYPNIINFYPLSCIQSNDVNQSRFETFKLDLIAQLQIVGTHQVYFTEQQFEVMRTLRDRARQQAFLQQKDFETLCTEQQITTEGEQNQDWLLDLLDKLGVVIHFPQLARLDSFILNPRWLTYGIYTLLYSRQAQESEGALSEASVIDILSRKNIDDGRGNILDYSPDKCGFIVDAMEEFKLCFRLPADRKQIIIPDLLPSDQPEHGFEKQKAGTLVFEFDFRGFLPRHVMPTFIVNRYDEFKNNSCWQQGVLLHSDQYDCDALVQVDYHNRTLSLWLQGRQFNRYFTVLRDEIISILQRIPDLSYQEWLWLSDDMRVQNERDNQFVFDSRMKPKHQAKANFKQLLALETARQTQYISEEGIYDLSRILQIMPEKLRKNVATKTDNGKALNKPSQSVKIFISYSHKNDEKYKDELVVTLKGIQREFPQLEWWHDRELEAGEWKKQILSKLKEADIVMLLISRDFMASNYCFNIEMQEALSKYQDKGHLVIPIIVRYTESWHKHEIGQFQALPKDAKPLDEWKNPDRFWGNVQRGLERELEQLLVN